MRMKNATGGTKEDGFREEIDPVEINQKKRKPPVTFKRIEKITLSGEEIEMLYGIDAGTLANYRSRKEGCRFYKVKRRVFYRKDEFEKWFFGNPILTIDSLRER
jgi:hypothetical protein